MPRKGKDLILPDISLADCIWGKCLEYGQRVALIDAGDLVAKSLTYHQIYELSRNCAAFLHNNGARVGDFIGICAPSCLEYVIAIIGIAGSGATIVPCNPALKKGEILQQFTISEPKMAIVHETAVETMKKVQAKLPCLERIFVIGKSDEFTTFDAICKTSIDMGFLKGVKIDQSEDIAILPYSSGTTGLPKSIMRTHKNLIAELSIFNAANLWGASEGVTVAYMNLKMFHALAFTFLLSSLFDGVKLVIEKEFEVEKMLKAIEKYKVNRIPTVPPIMIGLANAVNTELYNTSSLTSMIGGGAAMAPDIRRRLEERFGIDLIPVYGMTECGLISTGKKMKDDIYSVGNTPPAVEIKIIDLESSEECPDDKDGEVLVRGPQVMKGYLKNPDADVNTFGEDGWIHTGDIGHFDKDGSMYIVDRLKEVIRYGSLQVSPVELESVLLKHPKISDAGVIGIPDRNDGELPKAFVVRNVENLTEQEVEEYMRSKLVDYKHLRGGVEFIQSIPKSPTGKIQRKELKKMAGITV